MQHITITQCCQKEFSLNHTDTCLHKKKDWHNTAPYIFEETRYMYAVLCEAGQNPTISIYCKANTIKKTLFLIVQ